jgi:thiamine pyrophosphate-dependent acetolactate synthase large subunit-like protein
VTSSWFEVLIGGCTARLAGEFPFTNRSSGARRDHAPNGLSWPDETVFPESIYPHFVEISRGFGIAARQIRRKAAVDDAFAQMIADDGPSVLDVSVPYQEHVLPMIPAGMTVKDIMKS